MGKISRDCTDVKREDTMAMFWGMYLIWAGKGNLPPSGLQWWVGGRLGEGQRGTQLCCKGRTLHPSLKSYSRPRRRAVQSSSPFPLTQAFSALPIPWTRSFFFGVVVERGMLSRAYKDKECHPGLCLLYASSTTSPQL